jgi:hypothetical protein
VSLRSFKDASHSPGYTASGKRIIKEKYWIGSGVVTAYFGIFEMELKKNACKSIQNMFLGPPE